MTRQRRERPTAGAAVFLLFAAALVFGLTLGATSAEASLPRTADAAALNLAAPDAAAPELEAAWAVARDPLDDVALNHALDAAPRLGFASSLELLAPENAPPGFGLFSCPETSRCERTYARNNPLKYVDPDGNDARDAVSGFANAVSSNFSAGIGRIDSTSPDFQIGQAFGDGLSAIAGTAEALIGGGGVLGGFVLDATGAGAVVGVPAQIASAGLVAHGGSAAALGLWHLAEATHGHHTYPKAVGGHPNQPLADILAGSHIGAGGVHSDLARFEGAWLRPTKNMTGSKIIEKYGTQRIIDGLRRFYSQEKWKHLLPKLEEAVKFTLESTK